MPSIRNLWVRAALLILGALMSGCGPSPDEQTATAVALTAAAATSTPTITPTSTPRPAPTRTPTQAPPEWGDTVTWAASDGIAGDGIQVVTGGDKDTVAVVVGSPPEQARRTGNGEQLGAAASSVDRYMMFRIEDEFLYNGSPTTHVQIDVEYLDEGTDQFRIEYDAVAGGPSNDGRWMPTGFVRKTNSGEFRVATFYLTDTRFANRLQSSDFRITDWSDGAETIRRVTVTRIMPGAEQEMADSLLSAQYAQAERAFGPRSGRLWHNHSDNFLESRLAFVGLDNFIAESEFQNPYAASMNPWDFGFGFRFASWDIFFSLIVRSDQEWVLTYKEGDTYTTIDYGTVPDLRTGEGEWNKLELMVIGNTGYFFLNGKYVAELNLSGPWPTGGGGVFAGIGFYVGNEVGGYYTDYKDFSVWGLPE